MGGDAASKIQAQAAGQSHRTLDEKAKSRLKRAVREFESVIVGYMLKSMRGTVPKDEILGDGMGNEMMGSMFDMELAKQLSRNSSFGLGEMLYKEITGESLPHPERPIRPVTPQVVPETVLPKVVPANPEETARPAHPVLPVREGPIRMKIGHAVAERVNTYTPIINAAADHHGVDSSLLKAVMATESAGDTRARSSKEAKGLMQLVDSTASAMGVRNVWNPRDNIFGGAKYLQQLLQRFQGDVERAVASYNAGPGAVEKHGGIPPFKETKEYVTRVMEYLRYFKNEELTSDDKD